MIVTAPVVELTLSVPVNPAEAAAVIVAMVPLSVSEPDDARLMALLSRTSAVA